MNKIEGLMMAVVVVGSLAIGKAGIDINKSISEFNQAASSFSSGDSNNGNALDAQAQKDASTAELSAILGFGLAIPAVAGVAFSERKKILPPSKTVAVAPPPPQVIVFDVLAQRK